MLKREKSTSGTVVEYGSGLELDTLHRLIHTANATYRRGDSVWRSEPALRYAYSLMTKVEVPTRNYP